MKSKKKFFYCFYFILLYALFIYFFFVPKSNNFRTVMNGKFCQRNSLGTQKKWIVSTAINDTIRRFYNSTTDRGFQLLIMTDSKELEVFKTCILNLKSLELLDFKSFDSTSQNSNLKKNVGYLYAIQNF